jgi:hypothetical protein
MIKDLSEPSSKSMKKLIQLEPSTITEKTYEKLRLIAEKNPRELVVSERECRMIRVLNQLCNSAVKYCQTYKLNEPLRLKLAEASRMFELSRVDHAESTTNLNITNQRFRDLQSQFGSVNEHKKKLKE